MKSAVLRGWIRACLRLQGRRSGATEEASLGQFVHQQNIAIFRRLRGAQTDNNEARREKLLKLLAAEEAKIIAPSRHVVPPRSVSAETR
jgi:hypothetical protein